MAMKVSQLGLKPDEKNTIEETEEQKEEGEEGEENVDDSKIRFPKLNKIDHEFKGYKVKKYENNYNLAELLDNFRCYAASHLRLYYDASLLRAFFGGLACGN